MPSDAAEDGAPAPATRRTGPPIPQPQVYLRAPTKTPFAP
jgi:hypothetical protein